MSDKEIHEQSIEELYEEATEHTVNTGDVKTHAKRNSGKFRTLKWAANSIWLLFFIGPYFRLGDRQAILYDIPNRQFHLFHLTILPQDLWMLSYVLLFLAILLFVSTTLAGRVWCGFFCFQTVWTDVFTWVEEKFEGKPAQRRKLDAAPWDSKKIMIHVKKNLIWLLISILTGVSFVAWFTDVYQLWIDLFTFQAAYVAYFTVFLFICGTMYLAGYLREQTCFWLCPYARIQAVMVDNTSIVPCYDVTRGEKRGRLVKGKERPVDQGDCIDCNQCVAVCPTAVDIRGGQQEGCIMCGLCIDACDEVMEKIDKPKGLIRYASWDEIMGKKELPVYKRPRVIIYNSILLISVIGIVYGIMTMSSLELKTIHSRQPLFVQQSDGSIQNKYVLKILNKTNQDMKMLVEADNNHHFEGIEIDGLKDEIIAKHSTVTPITIFVRIPAQNLAKASNEITFTATGTDAEGNKHHASRDSVFIGPQK